MQSYINNSNNQTTLLKKQWAKYVSKGIALSLMHYNSDSPLFKSYKNTSYCADLLMTNEIGAINATYCKNRWCGICNRIKTARLINNYLPQIEQLQQPVFVTLTMPTCLGEDLKKQIQTMENAWRIIYKLSKKAKYKKTYSPLKGIRKAECTIRPNKLYHYHFHFILNDWSQGEWVIFQWLKYIPTAQPIAQHIRFADEFSHRELFKYAFKSEVKTSNKTNATRYDLVFKTLRNKRTIQSFGLTSIDEDFTDEDLHNPIILEGMANSIFKWCQNDWYDKNTGLALIGKEIPNRVKELVSYPETNTLQT